VSRIRLYNDSENVGIGRCSLNTGLLREKLPNMKIFKFLSVPAQVCDVSHAGKSAGGQKMTDKI
jgi:hypothetical protein